MDLQKSEELSRRFALLPIANHPNVPFAGPVIIDTHVPEASGAPPDVEASRFQGQPDTLQFYRLLSEQGQSHVRPQFAHHVTSILLAELQNFEELAQRSDGNFLENACVGKATSAFFQNINLGLLVHAAWWFSSRIRDDSLRIRHGRGELRKRAC